MTPQTPGQKLSSDPLVPFRWPSAWTDPALLRLFAASPINCLLFESLRSAQPVVDAARAAGLTALEWSALAATPLSEVNWDSPAPRIAITGLVWPRIKLSERTRGAVDAGPTGAPWIDSNTWVARLAAVRAPRRAVWLGFQLAKDDPVPGEAAYSIAIADSAASGARWMVALDDGLRQGLPAGNQDALKTWRGILAALAFFEKHRQWTGWEPWGSIGILSSFAGKDEFLGQEMLNLAARRNLFYRVLVRSVPASHKLEGLPAVLIVDNDPPSSELKNKLAAFVRAGGLLIVPRALAGQFPGEKTVPCPVAGYELRSFGKGSVAAATRDWDDPYFLAADVHNLVSRRHDPVTLFNARSLWGHYSAAPDGRAALLQLVGFTGRPNESVSLAAARPWRSAALYTIGTDQPAMLEPVRVEGRMEFHLPPFAYYAALEFQS
ncbi:MAG TPA: hypothetical protein VE959_15660 [Bryobacteraceae bacterium]|nr:hypothetical protein [Bryobacteraceae bacterium]